MTERENPVLAQLKGISDELIDFRNQTDQQIASIKKQLKRLEDQSTRFTASLDRIEKLCRDR